MVTNTSLLTVCEQSCHLPTRSKRHPSLFWRVSQSQNYISGSPSRPGTLLGMFHSVTAYHKHNHSGLSRAIRTPMKFRVINKIISKNKSLLKEINSDGQLATPRHLCLFLHYQPCSCYDDDTLVPLYTFTQILLLS